MAEKRTKEEVKQGRQELIKELDKLVKRVKEIKEENDELETRSRELNEEIDRLDARSWDIEIKLKKLKNEGKLRKIEFPNLTEGLAMRQEIEELKRKVRDLESKGSKPRPQYGPGGGMKVLYGLPDAPRAHLLKFGDGRTRILDSEEAVNVWINDPTNEQPVEIWEMKKRTKVPATAKA